MNPILLTPIDLAIASVLIVLDGVLSLVLRLGLHRQLAWAALLRQDAALPGSLPDLLPVRVRKSQLAQGWVTLAAEADRSVSRP